MTIDIRDYVIYWIAKHLESNELNDHVEYFNYEGGESIWGKSREPVGERKSKYHQTFCTDNSYLPGYSGSRIDFTDQLDEEGEYNIQKWEVFAFLDENPGFVAEVDRKRAQLKEVLVELTVAVEERLELAVNFAKRHNLPLVFQCNGNEVVVEKLGAVDWDSSSMYC